MTTKILDQYGKPIEEPKPVCGFGVFNIPEDAILCDDSPHGDFDWWKIYNKEDTTPIED